ncbi:MAG: hypothetical protein M1365_11305, partial [Actinobacteria bacterium]|nr:hypothetical protein [Actinomycetota bacterium]
YQNDDWDISFKIPDDWTFSESEEEKGLRVQLTPFSPNLEISFAFLADTAPADVTEAVYMSIYKQISDPISEGKKLTEIRSTTKNSISENNISYHEIVKVFEDENRNEWVMPACFIAHGKNLYVLFGIANSNLYIEDVIKIFYTAINSLEFTEE